MLKKFWLVPVVIVGLTISALQFQGHIRLARQIWSSKPKPASAVAVPTKPPANSIVVFNLRPQGDEDAVYYAMGFSRALSDWFYSAPKSIVMQPTSTDLMQRVLAVKHGPGYSISDDQARLAGKRLGVRYAMTGNLKLSGGRTSIELHILDVTARKEPVVVALEECALSDLPGAQMEAGKAVLAAMKLPKDTSPPPTNPCFIKPETLLLYGKSFLANVDQAGPLRWKMWEGERNSYFATLRMFEYVNLGPMTMREIQADRWVQDLTISAGTSFPGNAYVDLLQSDLQLRQFHYRDAQATLEMAVRKDPDLWLAHAALAQTAIYRLDSELALEEARKAVEMWPTSASSHALLSRACKTAAGSARQGRGFSRMSMSVQNTWRRHCEEAIREARIAVALDPDCQAAWHTMLVTAREIGIGPSKYMDEAYQNLIRINPRDMDAYEAYAYSFAPQWHNDKQKQEAILAEADKVFGKDSAEACVIRGWTLLANSDRAQTRELRLRLADTALSKTKDPGVRLSALKLKCRVLMGLKRHDEILAVAKQGFEICPDLDWRGELAKAYQFRWQYNSDRAALDKAADLLRVSVYEVPLSPYNHTQYGWCLSHQGNTQAARREFETALKIDPGNELAKEKLQYVK